MLRYEALMLTVPEITADETKALQDNLERIVKAHKATVVSYERWGKYRLAYPIDNNEYGVYFLMRFELDQQSAQDLLADINSLFTIKMHDIVMRAMITKLDSQETLVYHRPPSLEDAPAREATPFFGNQDREQDDQEMTQVEE